MASRKSQYRTNIVMGALVLVAALAVLWSRRQVPDSVREDRQGRVLRSLRRESITRIEVALGGNERFELRKDAPAAGGHWQLIANGRSYGADDPEVERLLTEAEFAAPARRLGPLDAASRERFGLARPRARVTLREGDRVTQSFAVGGLVADEQAAYVESEGQGFVVPKTFADAFVQRAMELRERTLSSLEPARTARLELDGEGGGRRVLERAGPVWRLTAPAEGRAARARVEAMLNALRDLRATRYLADDADDAALARYGLATPRLTVRATRDRGGAAPARWRFGGPCEGHDDEVTVARNDERTVACVGRAIFEDLARPASELRDDKLVWARADEVERVRVHSPTGEYTLVREGERWRMEGGTREADSDAVENWLNVLASFSAEARLDAATAASAHGLAQPAAFWIEITRTGVEGAERVNVGQPDADRMYVSRDDEPVVLGLEPTTAESLRVDPVRFRARRVVHDVPDEMTTLLVEAPEFRDESARTEGVWRLVRPFSALADPTSVRAASQQIASLNAERWVASQPAPEHGLSQPRMRVVARFEGAGPDPEPLADGGAPPDAGARPRLREYALSVGAAAPGGGFYAALAGRAGVFVLSSSAYGEIAQPHLDRNVLETDRVQVQRIEITRNRAQGGGGTERVAVRRDGETWRTDAGAPADRARVNALLDQLTLVRAPRVFGYGAAPASAQLGALTLVLTESGDAGTDGGAGAPRVTRIALGASFGAGDDAGSYARREGIDATLSVPRSVADALREFVP